MAFEKPKQLSGKLGVILILAALLIHPFDYSQSIEGWFIHLLLTIALPAFMVAIGLWVALFSGPIPVRSYPTATRPLGFFLVITGIGLLLWEVYGGRPVIGGLQNPWWLHFVASLLTTLVVSSGFGAAFTMVMGNERRKEAMLLATISVASFCGLIYLLAQGTPTDDPVFWRSASWGALGDLGGMLLGGGLALALFVCLVWQAEKKTGVPAEVELLDGEEKMRVTEVIASNLGGDEK